jgi:hypothetical protein
MTGIAIRVFIQSTPQYHRLWPFVVAAVAMTTDMLRRITGVFKINGGTPIPRLVSSSFVINRPYLTATTLRAD